jgi:hypothetical protein
MRPAVVCKPWPSIGDYDLEFRLSVFENRIPRQKFGPTRDAKGEFRRLCKEKLHSLNSSSNIINVVYRL